MNRFIYYFNIVSSKKVNSIEQAQELNAVIELKEFLDQLKSSSDSITIFDNQSQSRIMIWADQIETCTLEVHSASKGMIYHKQFLRKDLLLIEISMMDAYIDNPLKFGFKSSPF